jgi:hypothetical protein
MPDETVAQRGNSLFRRSMSCGDEGDERAILSIVVFDLVSLLTFPPLFRVPGYLPSDRLVSSVALHTRVLQGGQELCRIEGFDREKAVSELKVSIEAEAGLVPALTRLINPESHVELQDHLTLEDAGMPSDQALAEGVIQLYAQKLKRVVVADDMQIAPGEVTDSKLAVLCDSIKDDPPDILILCGCSLVTNLSCLVQLSTISHLDISGCNLGAKGGFHLADVIKDMGALTLLDISKNDLGQLIGWKYENCPNPDYWYQHSDGRHQQGKPEEEIGQRSPGVIALADAIRDSRAISSVNLLRNKIPTKQAQELVKIMQAKEKLVTLCGLSKDETELDFSKQNLCAGDAVLIANDISDMGAMTRLDISKNDIRATGCKALAEALTGNQVMKELNVASSQLTLKTDAKSMNDTDMSGVTTLADVISGMGALAKLDISGNGIGAEQEGDLQRICAAGGIELDK